MVIITVRTSGAGSSGSSARVGAPNELCTM